CPIFEVLYEGTRGPGKTDTLLMDFLQHVGVGWGQDWRGILFRQSHPQLKDIIAKSKKWITLMFPTAEYNKVEKVWTFEDGEQLIFNHMKHPDDYWNYHGHAYPWIGWEELTTWATLECYKLMMSCCRSTVGPERRDVHGRPMPRKYRSTTNPYGPGHNMVKRRFRLPEMRGKVIRDSRNEEGDLEPPRVAIHGRISENKILMRADPHYMSRVLAAARNSAERKAWKYGSWDITAGGMFDDIYDARYHAIEPFQIPRAWKIDRSFDWGSAKPFSVGWWAESDGSDVVYPDGTVRSTVRGDLFRVAEWYGTKTIGTNKGLLMTAGQIAKGIVEREIGLGWRSVDGRNCRVQKGPADPSIFDDSTKDRTAIADDMKKPIRVGGHHRVKGIYWVKADNARKPGWEVVRERLQNSLPPEAGGPREFPGLFVFRTCPAWLELVPPIPRDGTDIDDVDTDVEDHNADDTRYKVMQRLRRPARGGQVVGTQY
ncbi:MAG: terminase, partial [Candidatus Thermoplasmatota archaeon]|nr:terminase [Candidatus Thermoplasmatota archaeon]